MWSQRVGILFKSLFTFKHIICFILNLHLCTHLISIISREISCENQDPRCIKVSMLQPKEFKHIVGKAIQKFIAVKWPIEIRSSIRVGLLKVYSM